MDIYIYIYFVIVTIYAYKKIQKYFNNFGHIH